MTTTSIDHAQTAPHATTTTSRGWKAEVRAASVALAILTLVTGVAYPLAVTLVAQVVFPARANGSVIVRDGRVVGSELVGQSFDAPEYFWGRLSATTPAPYNAGASTGSNVGPTNPALVDAAKARIKALRDADPEATGPIPVDLVTASGSGLDPHVGVAAAKFQIRRVAKARGIGDAKVAQLVDAHTEAPTLGLLGEARINVVALNLALDRDYPRSTSDRLE